MVAATSRKQSRGRSSEKVRKNLVEADLLERAARLFAERGYAATSLEDVARDSGLSRPALYYYFSSKEDVLARLVSGLIASSEVALERIRAETTADLAQRLRVAVEALVGPVVEAPSRFRLLITYETELPAALGRRYLDVRRRIVREVGTIIAAGIETGAFRPVDERVATFTVLGMCNWVAWWHEPAKPDDFATLAADIAEMAISSLQAPGEGTAPATPAAILKTVRAQLTRLERLVEPGSASIGHATSSPPSRRSRRSSTSPTTPATSGAEPNR